MTSLTMNAACSPSLPMTHERPLCLYCGQTEVFEILEVWSPREFQIETCCEGSHASACELLAEDPKAAAQALKGLGLDALTGLRSRRVIDDGMGQLVIDWQLKIKPVSFSTAKAFVSEHHRHCPAPAGWRFGAGIFNGSTLIGVVMVGRPVARALDATRIVEVNRLCVRSDLAPGLSWNACSQLYGWASREALKRGFVKVITYTLEEESGVTLKAAGWAIEHTTKAKSWSTPSRLRTDKTPIVVKNRWTSGASVAI